MLIMNDFLAVLRPGTTIIGLIHELLSLFCDEESIAELFHALGVKRITVVLDTNVLLSDLKYCIQKKHHTGLMAAAKIGGVQLFASTTVRDEVPEKLDIFMSKYGIDPQEAQQVWDTQYVPWISFLDPSDLPPLSSKVTALLARDPDDVPTGQIIELLGPHLVLSRDEDLVSFGIIGQDIPLITCAYRDKTKKEATTLGISLGGGLIIQVSLEAVKSLIALLSKLDKMLLFGLLLLAMASLGTAVFYPPSRYWLQERGRRTIQSLGEELGPFIDVLLKLEAESAKATPIISQFRRSTTSPKTARNYAVKVLSEAFGSLSVREITRRMIMQGYKTSSEHPEYYVSRVLHKYPRLFEKTEERRWRLKSHLPDTLEKAV